MRYDRLALKFLDHLGVLGLSQGRIVKYAERLWLLLRIMDFNPKEATREDKMVIQRLEEMAKRLKDLEQTVRRYPNLTPKNVKI